MDAGQLKPGPQEARRTGLKAMQQRHEQITQLQCTQKRLTASTTAAAEILQKIAGVPEHRF
jgi:hypothetical protein